MGHFRYCGTSERGLQQKLTTTVKTLANVITCMSIQFNMKTFSSFLQFSFPPVPRHSPCITPSRLIHSRAKISTHPPPMDPPTPNQSPPPATPWDSGPGAPAEALPAHNNPIAQRPGGVRTGDDGGEAEWCRVDFSRGCDGWCSEKRAVLCG
jgi:hypothetical protein